MLRAFFLLISAFHATFATIQNCGKGSSLFQITELSLTPDPPQRGKEIEISVKFNNPEFSVVSGTSISSVILNYTPFPKNIESLCKSTTCPIDMGNNERKATSIWPENVYGLVKSKLEWFNDNNQHLLCIEISTKVTGFSFKNLINKHNESDTNFMRNLLNLRSTTSFNDWDPENSDLESYYYYDDNDNDDDYDIDSFNTTTN